MAFNALGDGAPAPPVAASVQGFFDLVKDRYGGFFG
jgi:hypothetical protein